MYVGNVLNAERLAIEQIDDPAKGNHRPRQPSEINAERNEIAERHPALDHLTSAEPDHDDDRQADHQFHRRIEHALDADQLLVLRHERLVHPVELRDLVLLLNERLHDADSRHALLHTRAKVGQLRLRFLREVVVPYHAAGGVDRTVVR